MPAAHPPSHLSSPPHRARPCRMEVRLLLASSPGEGEAPLGPAPPARMGLWVLVWGTQSPVAPGEAVCLPSHAWPRAEQEGQGAWQSSELPPLLGGGAGMLPPSCWLYQETPPVRPKLLWPLVPIVTSQTRAGAGWPWGLPSFRRRAVFECTHLCSPRLPLGPGLTISVPTAAREAEKGN